MLEITSCDTVNFRFTFLSDFLVNKEGVFVDIFFIENESLGIAEISSNLQLLVYPNSTYFKVFIEAENSLENAKFDLFDISGKHLATFNRQSGYNLNWI